MLEKLVSLFEDSDVQTIDNNYIVYYCFFDGNEDNYALESEPPPPKGRGF